MSDWAKRVNQKVWYTVACAFIFSVYFASMPQSAPPNSDEVRWPRYVEQKINLHESRRVLAWPVEEAWYHVCKSLGYTGRAFKTIQVLNAILAALTLTSVLWLFRRRQISWVLAFPGVVAIGLSPPWFASAIVSNVHIIGAAPGTLAVVLALGLSKEVVSRAWATVLIALLGTVSVLLQTNGIPFLLSAIAVVQFRSQNPLSRKLARGSVLVLCCFFIVFASVAVDKMASGQAANAQPTKWMSHPNAGMDDLGNPLKQALRGTAGIIAAFGGYSNVAKQGKAWLFKQPGRVEIGMWDWLSVVVGSFLVLAGLAAWVLSCREKMLRPDAIAASIILLLNAGFAFLWIADTWLWVGYSTFAWYLIVLVFGRMMPRRAVVSLLLTVIFLACSAYRTIESPCLITQRANDAVKRTLAFGKIAHPNDMVVGYYGDFPQIASYLYNVNTAYLFYMMHDDWRKRLMASIRNTVSGGGNVYVNKDVVEPTDIDIIEEWDRANRAGLLNRAELLDSLKSLGLLQRNDTLLPCGPIWVLQSPDGLPKLSAVSQ